jgi:hypothetical protein
MNCYATPFAIHRTGRVYVHFGSAGTACLTPARQGSLKTTAFRAATSRPASSPISFENLVILTMTALTCSKRRPDKKTGATVLTNRSVAWNDENTGANGEDGICAKPTAHR